MQKSESIKEIAIAMNKVQSKIVGATKDATNPFFKSRYATLENVMEAVRIPFQTCGLSYVQSSRVTDSGDLILETILMHISGEWISSEYPVKCLIVTTKKKDEKGIIVAVTEKENDPQSLGSAMSYARRYSLSAMCGVTQVDDDGNGATR